MDKQLLLTNSSHLDYKLIKSASFSELSSKKKVTVEKQFHTQNHVNLLKQYSCEEIFDKTSNTSQIKFSQTYKTDNVEHVDIWEKTVPVYDSLRKLPWFGTINEQTNFQKPFSSQNQTLTEENHVCSKVIILPAKLVIDENKLNQQSINKQSNSSDDKQIYLKHENISESSNYLFNKLVTVNQKSEYEKSDDHTQNLEPLSNTFELTTTEENRQHKLDTYQLKKRLRSLIVIEPKKKNNSHWCWSLTFFILFPIAILSLALIFTNVYTSNDFCTPRFNLKSITQELEKYVYDQDVAVSKLAKFFDEKDNQASFEVIAFVGGIGVGKSYTAAIIENHVKNTDTILDVFPPMYNKENQVYRALSVCHCNLIRLENLKTDDIVDAASFISNLKKRAEKYCILVLALFNTEEVDHNLKRTVDHARSVSLINDKFGEVNLQPNIVSFTSLSNDALIKCIKDAAAYNNMKLTDDNIDYVMHNLLTAESGCKGVYAKVQLIGKT